MNTAQYIYNIENIHIYVVYILSFVGHTVSVATQLLNSVIVA